MHFSWLLLITTSSICHIMFFYIYANLVILATAVTYYQLSGGESWTLRWLCSLLDKMDISCYMSIIIIELRLNLGIRGLKIMSKTNLESGPRFAEVCTHPPVTVHFIFKMHFSVLKYVNNKCDSIWIDLDKYLYNISTYPLISCRGEQFITQAFMPFYHRSCFESVDI